jgi:hypothetical protein
MRARGSHSLSFPGAILYVGRLTGVSPERSSPHITDYRLSNNIFINRMVLK